MPLRPVKAHLQNQTMRYTIYRVPKRVEVNSVNDAARLDVLIMVEAVNRPCIWGGIIHRHRRSRCALRNNNVQFLRQDSMSQQSGFFVAL